ncbi:MAG: hypothetical protein IKR76_07980 [Ruminococcus sp.]|nr:hypothetical protein [Ruminococcus sp.]
MTRKRTKAAYGSRLRLTAAAAVLCACVLCGCSDNEPGHSDVTTAPQATAAQQASVEVTETLPTEATTQKSSVTESSTAKKTAKTTAKTTAAQKSEKQSGTASKSTTKSTSQSSTGSTAQVTEPAVTQPSAKTQQTAPAADTATGKITSAKGMETGSKKATEKTPEKQPEPEYHIYADGYVTKYDELKLKNLTKKQRRAYDSLSEGIWKMQKHISIDSGVIKQSEAADFLYTVLGTMPEVNYVSGSFRITISGGYVTKYTMDYSLTPEKAQQEHRALRAAASKIIGSLSPDMSDADKVRYFHDYIIKHCDYTSDGGKSSYTAYGCLVEGKAVCEGYAMAMDYLCEKAGIYSLLVSGESTSSSGETLTHIWNKIQIDGKWYNFDVTWDDPVSAFGADYVRYDYYAVTDEEIEKTHKPERNRFGYYPEAAGVNENFFTKYGLCIGSTKEADEVIINALAKSLTEKQVCASVKCTDKEVYDEVCKLVMSSDDKTSEHKVSVYLKAACEKSGKSREYSGFYMVKNERLGVIAIILK